MSEWIKWEGGKCPIPNKAMVDVKFRDGSTCEGMQASLWDWTHTDEDGDIVAYKLAEVPK